MIVKEGSRSNIEPVPEGQHQAICDMVVDMGMQAGKWGEKHQLYLRFQLPNLMFEYKGEQKPRVLGITFTASLHQKASLRKFVEAWRGKHFTAKQLEGFEMNELAGKTAYLQVVHNEVGDNTYANISGVMALPKEMGQPEINGDPIVHDAETDNTKHLPEWLQKKVGDALPF